MKENTSMKLTLITDADAKVLREARKILKKLKKLENTLNCLENCDSTLDAKIAASKYKDWKTVARTHWKMYDELDALHVEIDDSTGELNLTTAAD